MSARHARAETEAGTDSVLATMLEGSSAHSGAYATIIEPVEDEDEDAEDFDALLDDLGRGMTGRWGHGSGPSLSPIIIDPPTREPQAGASGGFLSISQGGQRRWLVPRPGPWQRALGVVCVLLLALLALLSARAAEAAGAMITALREQLPGPRYQLLAEPLPPAAELLDTEQFAAWLEAAPRRSAALWRARAQLLTERRRWPEAAEAWQRAAWHDPAGQALSDRLAWIQALIRADRVAIATALLADLDLAEVDVETRTRVAELTALAWHAQRRPAAQPVTMDGGF